MKTETHTVNLNEFCAKEAGRYDGTKPWIFEGWEYATTGSIAVRVKSAQPDTKIGKRDFPPAHKLFKDIEGERLPWPEHQYVPKIIDCCKCGGSGKIGGCGGCDCGLCSGANGDECEACGGTGDIKSEEHVQVGVQMISAKYARLISALPNIVWLKKDDTTTTSPLFFLFENGEGIVMPIVGQFPSPQRGCSR